MKVLMLSQARQISDQPDYDQSFKNAKSGGYPVEFLNIPYIGFIEKYGGSAFYNEVVHINNEFKPDLIFFQFFHSANPGDPTDCVRTLRLASNKPLVFGSIGDLFDTGPLKFLGRPLPPHTIQLAACADAFFSTTMGNVADELVKYGAKNVIFLPNAFCPMHFPDWEEVRPAVTSRDVTMLCSNPRLLTRFPLRSYTNTIKRRFIVHRLKRHFGERFSIFGRGWNSGTHISAVPFEAQLDIYKHSRIVVDAPAPNINTDYYSSDRAFFMLGSGVPMVFFYTPRFEKMLRPDEHAFYVYAFRDLCGVCERALQFPPEMRLERHKQITTFVKSRHLIDHRVDTIISVAEILRKSYEGRIGPDEALRHVRMWHFLPEVDLRAECIFATRNWQA